MALNASAISPLQQTERRAEGLQKESAFGERQIALSKSAASRSAINDAISLIETSLTRAIQPIVMPARNLAPAQTMPVRGLVFAAKVANEGEASIEGRAAVLPMQGEGPRLSRRRSPITALRIRRDFNAFMRGPIRIAVQALSRRPATELQTQGLSPRHWRRRLSARSPSSVLHGEGGRSGPPSGVGAQEEKKAGISSRPSLVFQPAGCTKYGVTCRA